VGVGNRLVVAKPSSVAENRTQAPADGGACEDKRPLTVAPV